MAVELADAGSSKPSTRSVVRWDSGFWLSVVSACLVLSLAVTADSLWIDEGFSAWAASHNSLPSVLESLAAIGPDIQMPFHYVWLWVFTQVFGSSEYTLRAANLPFIPLYVLSLAIVSRVVFGHRFAWLPLALSPFAWYYVNEARAYFLLLTFSTAVTGAALTWAYGPDDIRAKSVWLFSGFFLFSLLTHVLALLAVPGLAAIIVAGWRRRRRIEWKQWRGPLLVFGLPTAALGLFYLFRIISGAPGHDYGSMTLLSIGGAIYEHLGFAGLGPPRNVIRSRSVDLGPYALWLALGGIGLTIAYAGLSRIRLMKPASVLVLACLLSLLATIAAGIVTESRFMGRHLAGALPLLLFMTLAQVRWRAQVMALAAVWATADYRLRVLPEYGKDDYKTAVEEIVRLSHARPGVIAWAADTLTASYYGLNLEDPRHTSQYDLDLPSMLRQVSWSLRERGLVVIDWNPTEVSQLIDASRLSGMPVYLALSKPDLYDSKKGWQSAIGAETAKLVGQPRTFTIFIFE